MPFVDEILYLEPVEPHSFTQFQNVGHGLSGRFRRGAKMRGNGLFLCEGFQSPLDDLFGRAIRAARKLLLQQLLTVGCKTNGVRMFSIREESASPQLSVSEGRPRPRFIGVCDLAVSAIAGAHPCAVPHGPAATRRHRAATPQRAANCPEKGSLRWPLPTGGGRCMERQSGVC
jgi:hypothetical protein